MKLKKRTEFSLRLVILIIMSGFLIFDLCLTILYPKTNYNGIRTLDRLDIYYAFFTTQTNYMVVLYLIFALFLKRTRNTKMPFGVELAVTTYITITMIVFWVGLLSSSNEAGSYKLPHWISTLTLHLAIPSTMIGHFILSSGDEYHSYLKHSKFNLCTTASYPIGYLAFSMMRGEYRYKNYGPDWFKYIYQYQGGKIIINPEMTQHWDTPTQDIIPYTDQMWYPYWFFDMHQYKLEIGDNVLIDHMQPEWILISIFVVACLAIAALVFGLQYLYLWHNNSKYWRWHDTNSTLLTQEEHDEKILSRKFIKIGIQQQSKLEKIERRKAFNEFKKTLKGLNSDEKLLKMQTYNQQISLEKILIKKAKKQQKLILKDERKTYKQFLDSLPVWTRDFVNEKVTEAKRLKKHTKKYSADPESVNSTVNN